MNQPDPGKVKLGPARKRKKKMKCFNVPSPTGNCRECGDPADPLEKGLCTDCAIENGTSVWSDPAKQPPSKDGSKK